jgi:hypothetical protein
MSKSMNVCRIWWPCSLRRGFEAAHLLGLRVRIPPGVWVPVACDCCVLSGRGLCDGPIPRPESPAESVVSECDPKISTMRRPGPTGVVKP